MENLENYIMELEQYKNNHPGLTEEVFIRYVYLDLASKFSFDVRFLPFGNSKKRQEIYRKGLSNKGINDCFNDNTVICNSLSRIFEYVLKHFDIDIRTVIDPNDIRRCPHVYNEIRYRNDKDYFKVDLQEDMYLIKMRAFTKNYGISTKTNERVIPREEIRKIDLELGYIDKDEYYTDEYVLFLKSYVDYIDDFFDKVEFVLENIECIDNEFINHIDRQWYHSKVLEKLFTKKEFDYETNKAKIRFVDCYKKDEDNIRYLNVIIVIHNNETRVYVYNKSKFKYSYIDLEHFANAVANGLTIYKTDVKQIEKALRRRKSM